MEHQLSSDSTCDSRYIDLHPWALTSNAASGSHLGRLSQDEGQVQHRSETPSHSLAAMLEKKVGRRGISGFSSIFGLTQGHVNRRAGAPCHQRAASAFVAHPPALARWWMQTRGAQSGHHYTAMPATPMHASVSHVTLRLCSGVLCPGARLDSCLAKRFRKGGAYNPPYQRGRGSIA